MLNDLSTIFSVSSLEMVDNYFIWVVVFQRREDLLCFFLGAKFFSESPRFSLGLSSPNPFRYVQDLQESLQALMDYHRNIHLGRKSPALNSNSG